MELDIKDGGFTKMPRNTALFSAVFLLLSSSFYAEKVTLVNPVPAVDWNGPDLGENVTVLTLCVVVEEDSYWVSKYDRVAAAVDLAITNANSFVLSPSVRFRPVIQPAGMTCSQIQHTVVTNLLDLMRKGTTCDAFIGIGEFLT